MQVSPKAVPYDIGVAKTNRGEPAHTSGLAIVVGNDALAQEVCRILAADGHDVTVIWGQDAPGLRRRIEECGGRFVDGDPRDPHVLFQAGAVPAGVLLALAEDDRINLEVALQAREANPGVRIVMRQYNRALARKLAENLTNCAVVSLAAHSAATYAAAAVDPECFLGIEFPTGSHELVGFSRRAPRELGVSGMRLIDAEHRLQCRILACDGDLRDRDRVLAPNDELTLFGRVERLSLAAMPLKKARRDVSWVATRIRLIASEFDPLLRVLVVAGAAVFVIATAYFGIALHLSPVTAAYFVTATMTTVGYGDIALADKGALSQIAGMLLMLAGLLIANLALAFVAAALIRAQWNALQGLRPIRQAGHIVVFGAGRVGTRVVDFLCELGATVAVVERTPAPELVARARLETSASLPGTARSMQRSSSATCGPPGARSSLPIATPPISKLLLAREHVAAISPSSCALPSRTSRR